MTSTVLGSSLGAVRNESKNRCLSCLVTDFRTRDCRFCCWGLSSFNQLSCALSAFRGAVPPVRGKPPPEAAIKSLKRLTIHRAALQWVSYPCAGESWCVFNKDMPCVQDEHVKPCWKTWFGCFRKITRAGTSAHTVSASCPTGARTV